jgi:hypothetical protein
VIPFGFSFTPLGYADRYLSKQEEITGEGIAQQTTSPATSSREENESAAAALLRAPKGAQFLLIGIHANHADPYLVSWSSPDDELESSSLM